MLHVYPWGQQWIESSSITTFFFFSINDHLLQRRASAKISNKKRKCFIWINRN
jgi:hypothetical protein